MSGFINHLVSNHINPVDNVLPRLKGRFESFSVFQQTSQNAFGDEHVENNSISTEYNSTHYPSQNKPANNDLYFRDVQKNQDEGNIANDDTLEKIIPVVQSKKANPLNTASHFSDTQNNQQKHETSDSPLLIPTFPLNVNSIQSHVSATGSNDMIVEHPDNDVSNVPFTEKTNINHLLIPDGDAVRGNSLMQQNYLNEQKINNFNDAEYNFLLQQHNTRTQVNMPVIDAFRQMYKNGALKNIGEAETDSVIKVNIGRIDVRAITQQTPIRETIRTKPSMSLDDFLKKKNSSR